jgi:hypothetical protein
MQPNATFSASGATTTQVPYKNIKSPHISNITVMMATPQPSRHYAGSPELFQFRYNTSYCSIQQPCGIANLLLMMMLPLLLLVLPLLLLLLLCASQLGACSCKSRCSSHL